MANLTLSIDDEVLRRARIRALERGTSVNALIRDYLEFFAGEDDGASAINGFLSIAKRSRAKAGRRIWTRDELHER